jgi:replicative DNA helicase
MKLEYIIIKYILDYNIFLKYSQYIDSKYFKNYYPEVYRIFLCIEKFFETNHRDLSVPELQVLFFADYPGSSVKDYDLIFKQIEDAVIPESTESLFTSLVKKIKATRVADAAISYVQSDLADDSTLQQALSEYDKIIDQPVDDIKLVSTNLEELYVQQRSKPGLRWRLRSLNEMVGSLRKGDFAVIFARPETGKTTFLADNVAGWLEQLASSGGGPVLWFNNEEQSGKVILRVYQSMFSVTLSDLGKKTKEYQDKFDSISRGRLIFPDGVNDKAGIEKACERYNPGCIIFDQLDKVVGFQADRRDLELKAAYCWARELAKKYCPVLGVCQAAASGENKRWLGMGDLDDSKTGKPGEADLILGIGKTESAVNVRHLHACKNKLDGDEDTKPELRHGYIDVLIRADIARYEDI